jgi:hypothetical protein
MRSRRAESLCLRVARSRNVRCDTSTPAGSVNYNASANVRPRSVGIGPVSRVSVPIRIGWVAIAISGSVAIGGIAVPVGISRIAVSVIAWVCVRRTCYRCACECANREPTQSPAPASPPSLCLSRRRDGRHCQSRGEHQGQNRSFHRRKVAPRPRSATTINSRLAITEFWQTGG